MACTSPAWKPPIVCHQPYKKYIKFFSLTKVPTYLHGLIYNPRAYRSLCSNYIGRVKITFARGLLYLKFCQECSSPEYLCATQISAEMWLLQRGQPWPYKIKYSPDSLYQILPFPCSHRNYHNLKLHSGLYWLDYCLFSSSLTQNLNSMKATNLLVYGLS